MRRHDSVSSFNPGRRASWPALPLLAVLFYPRLTIRDIIGSFPLRWVNRLIFLGVVSERLFRAAGERQGDTMSLTGLLAAILGSAFFAVVIGQFVGSGMLLWVGRAIGGAASLSEVRAAIAWSFAPFIWALPIWFLMLATFGRDLFRSQTGSAGGLPFTEAEGLIVWTLAGLWTMVLAVATLAEVQRFSIWRAILTHLLIALGLVAIILAVIAILALIGPSIVPPS